MTTNVCLILEVSDCNDWGSLRSGTVQEVGNLPVRIPEARRPAVLQPDVKTAEEEAKRLAGAHPGKRFAIFKVTSMAQMATVPSHVNLRGEELLSQRIPIVVDVADPDDLIPF